MTLVNAMVVIFGMFFFVILVGVLSHHLLERIRITSGYYEETKESTSSPVPFN